MRLAILNKPKRTCTHKRESWLVRYPLDGKAARKYFLARADAFDFYERKKTEIAKFGSSDALKDEHRIDAARAVEILKPYGVSLLEAAKIVADMKAAQIGGVALDKAISGFIDSRTKGGCSSPYVAGLKNRLGFSNPKEGIVPRPNSFAAKFPNATVKELSTEKVDDFLKGLGTSAGNAAAQRRELMAFFTYCEGQGFIDKNPVTRAIKFKRKVGKIGILTPAQCRELLDNCPDEIKGAVAVQVFCGLRAAEASRLQCDAIDAFQKVVTVDAGIAKTASRRTVPMNKAAAAWLMPFHGREGAIMPPNYRNLFDIAKVKSGFKPSYEKRNSEALQAVIAEAKAQKRKLAPWPDNALRHSAISYTLAVNEDIYKTATAAGNSPDVIRSHYLHLVKPEDAAEFLNILPARAQAAAKRAKSA